MQDPDQQPASRHGADSTQAKTPPRRVRWYYGFCWDPFKIVKRYQQLDPKPLDTPDFDVDDFFLSFMQNPGSEALGATLDHLYRWVRLSVMELLDFDWDTTRRKPAYDKSHDNYDDACVDVYAFVTARAYTEDELDITAPEFAAQLPKKFNKEEAERVLGPIGWYMDSDDADRYGLLEHLKKWRSQT
ncbi:hypothetical protein OH77DRAFT_1423007 [Trametes cingulata]|nr:hypothetical protein OH77DRAFT_1423007 [Trametes cingulata]